MNDVLLRRLTKHRKTIDIRRSSIRRLGDLQNIIVGEVMGIDDSRPYCFFIRESDSTISVSDMLDFRKSKLDYQYNVVSGLYFGKGVRSEYKTCERIICYILILLEYLDVDSNQALPISQSSNDLTY